MPAQPGNTAGSAAPTVSSTTNIKITANKPSSTLKLEPVALADIPEITNVWYAAFGASAEMRRMFPDTPAVRQWLDDANRHDLLHKPFQRYLKVVDTAADGGKLIAFAKWDLSMPEARGSRFPPWHEESDGEMCGKFFGALDEERKRLLGEEKNYYLDTLATYPEHERRGAGSMLVQWGCDLADEDGVPAYVDASKAGSPLYQKFGFEDRSDPQRSTSGVASMVRDARVLGPDKK